MVFFVLTMVYAHMGSYMQWDSAGVMNQRDKRRNAFLPLVSSSLLSSVAEGGGMIKVNELLKIEVNEKQEPTVSGRQLHVFLEVDTPYHKWMPRMIEYGFIENEDFEVTDKNVHNSNGGKQNVIDHFLSVDMTEVSKVLNAKGMGRNKLFKLLRDRKILRYNNTPYQEFVDRGYFKIIEQTDRKDPTHIYLKTVVFQKGVDYIRKLVTGDKNV